ncbi:hypothetical protein J1614_008883 [Plenodomus biglobosus]|nr:hypothetical protein J1614_008883 [Plenodomus biglobosus]
MRLLHARTFEFHVFEGLYIPGYAILSHRWEGKEISFKEMEEVHKIMESPARRPYFEKVRQCCLQAIEDKLDYVWIDTCCIDKSSSAELSEAINSMYQWYEGSEICYAYLSDVQYEYEGANLSTKILMETRKFEDSKWWTRGWTLQELLAPEVVKFFAPGPVNWVAIGTRESLISEISLRTNIDHETLLGRDVELSSVGRRMSWAAERETTRPEDLAYCLLGLFRVNMPLLYGEGDRAFLRLQVSQGMPYSVQYLLVQEEIMKSSDDQTILAWEVDLATTDFKSVICGPLATSPSQFRGSDDLLPIVDPKMDKPYSMTNKGLLIELQIVQEDGMSATGLLQASTSGTYNSQIQLPLVRLTKEESSYYARDSRITGTLAQSTGNLISHGVLKTIFIKQNPEQITRSRINMIAQTQGLDKYGYSPAFLHPSSITSETTENNLLVNSFPFGCRRGMIWFACEDQSHAVILIRPPSHPREYMACSILYCPPPGTPFQLSPAQIKLQRMILEARPSHDVIHQHKHVNLDTKDGTCPTRDWRSKLPYTGISEHDIEALYEMSTMTSPRNCIHLADGRAIYTMADLDSLKGQHTWIVNIYFQNYVVDPPPYALCFAEDDLSMEDESSQGNSPADEPDRKRARH